MFRYGVLQLIPLAIPDELPGASVPDQQWSKKSWAWRCHGELPRHWSALMKGTLALTTDNFYNASKLRQTAPSLWQASDQRERFNVDLRVCTRSRPCCGSAIYHPSTAEICGRRNGSVECVIELVRITSGLDASVAYEPNRGDIRLLRLELLRDRHVLASVVSVERRDHRFGLACISQRPFGDRLCSGRVV